MSYLETIADTITRQSGMAIARDKYRELKKSTFLLVIRRKFLDKSCVEHLRN